MNGASNGMIRSTSIARFQIAKVTDDDRLSQKLLIEATSVPASK